MRMTVENPLESQASARGPGSGGVMRADKISLVKLMRYWKVSLDMMTVRGQQGRTTRSTTSFQVVAAR